MKDLTTLKKESQWKKTGVVKSVTSTPQKNNTKFDKKQIIDWKDWNRK